MAPRQTPSYGIVNETTPLQVSPDQSFEDDNEDEKRHHGVTTNKRRTALFFFLSVVIIPVLLVALFIFRGGKSRAGGTSATNALGGGGGAAGRTTYPLTSKSPEETFEWLQGVDRSVGADPSEIWGSRKGPYPTNSWYLVREIFP
jgi:hypothetical protein